MTQENPDVRDLPEDDFRTHRAYLADHVFFIVPGGGASPTDTVEPRAWHHFMTLSTDVLLRTTDYQGSLVNDCINQSSLWTHASPLPDDSRYMFEPAMDAGDDFSAAPFIAAHGWYRQSTILLRSALEVMTEGAAHAINLSEAEFDKWRAGERDLNFKTSLSRLRRHGRSTVFDYNDGVLGRLYRSLSDSAHSRPGRTNADIWNSNGPVWVAHGFRDFWLNYCDTVAACYLLLKIGWPSLELPEAAQPLFGSPSPSWGVEGSDVIATVFGQ